MLNDQFLQNKPQQSYGQPTQPQQPGFGGPGSNSGLMSDFSQIHQILDGPPPTRPGPDVGAISIRRMILIDTGRFNPQYRRSYETQYTAGTIEQIRERMISQPRFNAAQIGGLASQFLAPSANTEGIVPAIGNDWDNNRCRFVMEVEYRFHGGSVIREFVTGGTSHVGVVTSMGTAARHGSLDPQMRFKINNIVRIRESVVRTPVGLQTNRNIAEAAHLVSNNSWNGVYNTAQHETRLRPADTFAIMSRSHLDLGGDAYDTRTTASRVPVMSSRSNGSAAAYLTKMMEGYKHAVVTNINNDADAASVLATARSMVEEPSVQDDRFLTAIRNVTGNPTITDNFTWADLMRLQPNVDNVTEVRLMGEASRQNISFDRQNSSELGGSRHVDVAQALIAQAVPGIILNYGATLLSFHATNKLMGSQHTVTISNIESLGNADMSPYADTIRQQLIMHVLQDVSFNNQEPYEIHATIDVLGTSIIEIDISGEQGRYGLPSFMDSMFTPIVTTDANRTGTIARDFEILMNEVVEETNGFQHQRQNGGYNAGATRVDPFQM